MVACAAYRHVDLVAAATGEVLARLPFPGWANCCCAAAGRLVAVGDGGHVRCWSASAWPTVPNTLLPNCPVANNSV